MLNHEQSRNANSLLRQGRSDEDVERLTGVTLLDIIGMRGALASMTMEMKTQKRISRRSWLR